MHDDIGLAATCGLERALEVLEEVVAAASADDARPGCGARLRLVALIDDPAVVERILRHLRLPADRPSTRPARPPPLLDEALSC